MNLALSEEQTMIRDAAAEVLAERSPSTAVRHAIEHTAGRDDALWRTLGGELGWCGRKRWVAPDLARWSWFC
jgi:hypothetical protein